MKVPSRFLPLALALALSACSQAPGSGTGKASPPPPPPPVVKVEEVRSREVRRVREYPGETVARRTVEVKSQVEGMVLDFAFAEGSRVSQGQLLFQVDPRPFQAALAAAEAQAARIEADLHFARNQVNLKRVRADLLAAEADLARARQEVERYRPLAERQVIPRQTFDNALAAQNVALARVEAARATVDNTRLSDGASVENLRAQLLAAQAQIESARLTLSYCDIRSPIHGIVGKLHINPGNLVKVADVALATIVEVQPIFVDFSVSEVEQMQPTSASPRYHLILADGSRYPYEGRLFLTNPSLDRQSGTLTSRLSFPNPEARLRPGQFARVRVEPARGQEQMVIPQRAVVELQSLKAVYVLREDSTVEQRQVELEPAYEGFFPVKAGLAPGERVVVEGVQKLRPNLTVKVDEGS